MAKSLFEHLPSVQELLESPPLRDVLERVNRNAVVSEVRSVLDKLRTEIQSRAGDLPVPTRSELAHRIADWIQRKEQPQLRPVINATGNLLDSVLGRAPLAAVAIDAIAATAGDYCNLELDLEGGECHDRINSVERTLTELTGAERVLVVNNGAAATVLVLSAFASGRQVIVSRGELVETGDAYRLPEALAASGAVVREVGTTNCTRPDDYRSACGPETGAIMKVHVGDFEIVGHHEAVDLSQLVALGRSKNVPVIFDLGAGALIDLQPNGILNPSARDAVATGADVVVMCGDKWLGGPQCGIILCRREQYLPLMSHPLARAFRVDKLTLSALLATLQLYRASATPEADVPVLSLLSTSCENLKNRAERLAPRIAASAAVLAADVRPGETQRERETTITELVARTWCIAVEPQGRSAHQLAKQLRTGVPAVVARVHQDRVLLDLRTVFPRQDQLLVDAFSQIGKDPES